MKKSNLKKRVNANKAKIKKLGSNKSVKITKKTAKRAGLKPILTEKQTETLKKMYAKGKNTSQELAEKFKVSIPTIYRYLKK